MQEIRKLTKGFSHVSHCRYHIFNALSAFIFEVFGNIYSALCGYPQECFSNNTLQNLEKLTPTRYWGVPRDNISRISASSKESKGLLKDVVFILYIFSRPELSENKEYKTTSFSNPLESLDEADIYSGYIIPRYPPVACGGKLFMILQRVI